MPYPNQHAFRLIQPSEFIDGSIYTVDLGDGISIIVGRLKSTGKTTRQAVRFDRTKHTYEQARKWVKDHNYQPILSEKATG